MQYLLTIIFCFIVTGCYSERILNKDKKILEIKCTIGIDTLDTFNNTFTRVYYGEEVYTVSFSFSIEEQQRIISEINKVNFYNLPDSLPHRNLNYDINTPIEQLVIRTSGDWGDQFIDVLLNDKRKKVFWVNYASYANSDEYIRLNSVMQIIREIVWNREEIKNLPMESGTKEF